MAERALVNPKKSPVELRRDIAETRVRIDDTIEQLKGHFSSESLKSRFMDEFKSIGKAGSRFRETGSSFIDRIMQNPIPAAMAGTGLIFLFAKGSNKGVNVSEETHEEGGLEGAAQGAREKIRGLTSSVSGKTKEFKGRARETARAAGAKAGEARERISDIIESNPLAVIAAAFAIGSAIGLILPGTGIERETMGEAGATLVERAEQAVEETQRKAEEDIGKAA